MYSSYVRTLAENEYQGRLKNITLHRPKYRLLQTVMQGKIKGRIESAEKICHGFVTSKPGQNLIQKDSLESTPIENDKMSSIRW